MNTVLTHKVVSGTDAYNAPTVSSTASIYCKLKFKNRIIKNGLGKDVNVMAEFTTLTAINAGDILTINSKDWEIQQASPIYNFDGLILHYKGFI
jgi:hypothetical protein